MFSVSGQFENDTLILAPFWISHCAPDGRVEEVEEGRRGRGNSARCQSVCSVCRRRTVQEEFEKTKALLKNKSLSKLPFLAPPSDGLDLLSVFLLRFMQEPRCSSTPNKAMCRQNMQGLDGPSQPRCIASNANTPGD